MIVTDPPYNVDVSVKLLGVAKHRDGHKKQKGSNSKIKQYEQQALKNDAMSVDEYARFLDKAFEMSHSVAKDGCVIYVFYAMNMSPQVFGAVGKHFYLYQHLIWVKHHFSLGHTDYHYRHEPILYGYKQGAKHYFTNSRSEDTVIDDSIDLSALKKMSKAEFLVMAKELLDADKTPTTVLYENKPESSDMHPTMKPVKLIARLVRNSSRNGELVFDPFGGSGTTMIACEQLNRSCYMSELEPKYCDVIVERWEKLTGQKAVKV